MTKSSQSEKHAAMIARNCEILASRGWVTRCEELHADVVTFLPGQRGVWAVENELRCNTYWIRRNAMRNGRHGACGIVFVADSGMVADKIGKVVGSLPLEIRKITVVVTTHEFSSQFVRDVMERRLRKT